VLLWQGTCCLTGLDLCSIAKPAFSHREVHQITGINIKKYSYLNGVTRIKKEPMLTECWAGPFSRAHVEQEAVAAFDVPFPPGKKS
jgi:hypothetical protein